MKKFIEKFFHYSLDIKLKNIKKRFATSIEKNINGKKKFVFSLLEEEIELIDRRFEDLKYYIDKRIGFIERIIIGFNVPILITVIAILIRMFI